MRPDPPHSARASARAAPGQHANVAFEGGIISEEVGYPVGAEKVRTAATQVLFDAAGGSPFERSFRLRVGASNRGISIIARAASIISYEDLGAPPGVDGAISFARSEVCATPGTPPHPAGPSPIRDVGSTGDSKSRAPSTQ